MSALAAEVAPRAAPGASVRAVPLAPQPHDTDLPGGLELPQINEWKVMAVSNQAYEAAATELDVDVPAVMAIAAVESQGNGFYDNGEVKILFERHIFYKQLKKNRGQALADSTYKAQPDICNPSAGGYGKFSEQHPKLRRAEQVDKTSAREACSWGAFQVLGRNWPDLGYASVQELVNDAFSDEGQLRMFVRFIKTKKGLLAALKAHNWPEVAAAYNGPSYKQFHYDTKLAQEFEKAGGH